MKLLFLSLLVVSMHLNPDPTLAELRNCYRQAATQKAVAKKLDQLLAKVDTSAAPVLIGYKGANEMIQAKYVINPIAKLSKFNRGKDFLQLAVNRDSSNLETRFLRFSVQSNIPVWLNYKDEMIADKCFLIAHLNRSNDQELKDMIISYFFATNILTDIEIKRIKN